MIQALAILLVGCVALVGCGDDYGSGPSSSPSFSVTDLVVGSGAEATDGQQLTVDYAGWLYDSAASEKKGVLFDTTDGRGPFTFVLGAGEVIQGWDQGIVGMRVGGTRQLVIPPNLAYGSQGSGNVIPPNSTLIFDVDLLSVQ